jgi:hypothetical protein
MFAYRAFFSKRGITSDLMHTSICYFFFETRHPLRGPTYIESTKRSSYYRLHTTTIKLSCYKKEKQNEASSRLRKQLQKAGQGN